MVDKDVVKNVHVFHYFLCLNTIKFTKLINQFQYFLHVEFCIEIEGVLDDHLLLTLSFSPNNLFCFGGNFLVFPCFTTFLVFQWIVVVKWTPRMPYCFVSFVIKFESTLNMFIYYSFTLGMLLLVNKNSFQCLCLYWFMTAFVTQIFHISNVKIQNITTGHICFQNSKLHMQSLFHFYLLNLRKNILMKDGLVMYSLHTPLQSSFLVLCVGQ